MIGSIGVIVPICSQPGNRALFVRRDINHEAEIRVPFNFENILVCDLPPQMEKVSSNGVIPQFAPSEIAWKNDPVEFIFFRPDCRNATWGQSNWGMEEIEIRRDVTFQVDFRKNSDFASWGIPVIDDIGTKFKLSVVPLTLTVGVPVSTEA